MKNPAAVALGRMAKGKPKSYSKAERTRRKRLMDAINKRRKERK